MAPAVHLRCQQLSIIPSPASMAAFWPCRVRSPDSGPVRQRQSRGPRPGQHSPWLQPGLILGLSCCLHPAVQGRFSARSLELASASAALGSGCDWQLRLAVVANVSGSARLSWFTQQGPAPSQKRHTATGGAHHAHGTPGAGQADQATVGSLDTSNSSVLPDFPSHELRVRRTSKSEIQLGVRT